MIFEEIELDPESFIDFVESKINVLYKKVGRYMFGKYRVRISIDGKEHQGDVESAKLNRQRDIQMKEEEKRMKLETSRFCDSFYVEGNEVCDREKTPYEYYCEKEEKAFEKIKKYLHPKTEINEWL